MSFHVQWFVNIYLLFLTTFSRKEFHIFRDFSGPRFSNCGLFRISRGLVKKSCILAGCSVHTCTSTNAVRMVIIDQFLEDLVEESVNIACAINPQLLVDKLMVPKLLLTEKPGLKY